MIMKDIWEELDNLDECYLDEDIKDEDDFDVDEICNPTDNELKFAN